MDFGPYSASKAAPANRQPCECGRPITKDGKTFPHKYDSLKCYLWLMTQVPEYSESETSDYDLIDESRAMEAREQNSITRGRL